MISPKISRIIQLLPKNVVSYLARKVLDGIINKHASIIVHGEEKLSSIKSPALYICNHLSNSDAFIIEKVLREKDLTFVAGVKLSQNATTNMGIYVVKTTPLIPNTADKDGISKIIHILKSGGNVLLFPEGTRSRKKRLIEVKKGILLIAKVSKVPIVPLALWGTENLLPINEQGDMASENFHDAQVNLSIGNSFNLPEKKEGEAKVDYEERALSEIMHNIAALLPKNYRGVYDFED